MELNLTIPHLLGFCFVVYIASYFITGTRFWRIVGWVGLWQLITPVRPIWQDVPMMIALFVVAESVYFMVRKSTSKNGAV